MTLSRAVLGIRDNTKYWVPTAPAHSSFFHFHLHPHPPSSSASSSCPPASIIPPRLVSPHPCLIPNRSAQPISSCGPCQFEWPRRPDWPKRHAVRAAERTAWLQRTNSHGPRTHHSQPFRAAHTESNLCVLAACRHPLHFPVM